MNPPIDALSRALDEGFELTGVKLGGVTVERRDTDLWAVVDGSFCLNRKGEWEYERRPSGRDEAFLARCRFSFAEAVESALAGRRPEPAFGLAPSSEG